jgi:hypothetical protein
MQTRDTAGDGAPPPQAALSVSLHRMRNGFMVIGGDDRLNTGTVHHTLDGALTQAGKLLAPVATLPKTKRTPKA